ncbi:hypothetical protein [Streptococcus pneumoniae]|uniref:hypothetical protein n=1 Tax=Streptococcus pneumoniae TaxID=1313 RepID=UPI00214DA16C|nr:hypothetical protein [Streptococcus pneumoniae]
MKIKEQTRKLAVSCSKYIFEVAVAQNTVLRLQIGLTKSVTYIRQGDADVV